MKYKVIEDVTSMCFESSNNPPLKDGCYIKKVIIPAGTIIPLEAVEEVKVKAFVPKERINEILIVLTDAIGYDHTTEHRIAFEQAKLELIELFNSFK